MSETGTAAPGAAYRAVLPGARVCAHGEARGGALPVLNVVYARAYGDTTHATVTRALQNEEPG